MPFPRCKANVYDLAFAKRPAEELYDLRRDPGQTTNVAAETSYAGVKERLEAYPYYGASPMKPVAPPRPQ